MEEAASKAVRQAAIAEKKLAEELKLRKEEEDAEAARLQERAKRNEEHATSDPCISNLTPTLIVGKKN